MKKILTAALCCLMLGTVCFGFTACGESLKGFDIELAKAVCEDLGIEVEFQKILWDNKETELKSKNIDLIWNGLTISDERKEQFSISTPYMNNKQVAVIRKEDVSKYTDKVSIGSAKLTAEKKSAGADVIDEQFANATSAKVESQVNAMLEVQAKTSDVAIIDSVMAIYYTQTGQFKDKLVIISDLIFVEEQYGVAARKEDKGIIDKVNLSLAKMYKNGKIMEIAKRYNLEKEIIDCGDYVSTGETAGWDYISEKGKIVIGYTLFAPIAFE